MIELSHMPTNAVAHGYVACTSIEQARIEYQKQTGKEPQAYYIRKHSTCGFQTIYLFDQIEGDTNDGKDIIAQ